MAKEKQLATHAMAALSLVLFIVAAHATHVPESSGSAVQSTAPQQATKKSSTSADVSSASPAFPPHYFDRSTPPLTIRHVSSSEGDLHPPPPPTRHARLHHPLYPPPSLRRRPSQGGPGGETAPPYAVQMEPLVKYSPRDPLYANEGGAVVEEKKEEQRATEGPEKEPSQSLDAEDEEVVPEDQEGGAATLRSLHAEEKSSSGHSIHHFQSDAPDHRRVPFSYHSPPPHYGPPYQERDNRHGHLPFPQGPRYVILREPEPIIEIIVKESNHSLPPPPTTPTILTTKPREPVHVFYVKYERKKGKSGGDGEKVVFDPPIPAKAPSSPEPLPPVHIPEESEKVPVIAPPLLSHPPQVTAETTTLRAVIRPDSETVHLPHARTPGLRVTFGEERPNAKESEIVEEEQSAPQPSFAAPSWGSGGPSPIPPFRHLPEQHFRGGSQGATSRYFPPSQPQQQQQQSFGPTPQTHFPPQQQREGPAPDARAFPPLPRSPSPPPPHGHFPPYSPGQGNRNVPGFPLPHYHPGQQQSQPHLRQQQLQQFYHHHQQQKNLLPFQEQHKQQQGLQFQRLPTQLPPGKPSSLPSFHVGPQPPSFPPPPPHFQHHQQPSQQQLQQSPHQQLQQSPHQQQHQQPTHQQHLPPQQQHQPPPQQQHQQPPHQQQQKLPNQPNQQSPPHPQHQQQPRQQHQQPTHQQNQQQQQYQHHSVPPPSTPPFIRLPVSQSQRFPEAPHPGVPKHGGEIIKSITHSEQHHVQSPVKQGHSFSLDFPERNLPPKGPTPDPHFARNQPASTYRPQLPQQPQPHQPQPHQPQPHQPQPHQPPFGRPLNQQDYKTPSGHLEPNRQQTPAIPNQSSHPQRQNQFNVGPVHLGHDRFNSGHQDLANRINNGLSQQNSSPSPTPGPSYGTTVLHYPTTTPNTAQQINSLGQQNIHHGSNPSFQRVTTPQPPTTTTPTPTSSTTQKIPELPDEIPDDLRQQLLSSGILSNADIQILDYDKIGDIPIESLPPEALSGLAGSGLEPAASENKPVTVAAPTSKVKEAVEMKVVRYTPGSEELAVDGLIRDDVEETRVLAPVTTSQEGEENVEGFRRYLPLRISGERFPVPDVPELRGRNVTSVVVLAPVGFPDRGRERRAEDEPEVKAEGEAEDILASGRLNALVKDPSTENFKQWLEAEKKASPDEQAVVLLVSPKDDQPEEKGDIYMLDVGSGQVSQLRGELSAAFVQVAKANARDGGLDVEEGSPSKLGR